MEAVRHHFRHHGAVHAVWVIALLLLTIAALILMTPDGESVGDYIAFATSIASLVLAVVAIIHSLVANQSFSETVGSLKTSADDVKAAAGNICAVSTTLTTQSEKLLGEVSGLSPAVQSISDKIDEKFAQAAPAAPVSKKQFEMGSNNDLYDRSPYGGRVALYLLSRGLISGKHFDVNKIFKDSQVWGNFVAGYLHALKATEYSGIDVGFKTYEDDYYFITSSLGDLNAAEILKQFSSVVDEYSIQLRRSIDSYFSELDNSPVASVEE